jgi:hypothetical protein
MWTFTGKPATAPLCRIAGSGEVRRGDRIERITGDFSLFRGDVVTATSSGATVRYEDRTTLALAAGARLHLFAPDDRAGKRAKLEAGSLQADVVPQPSGRPLMIATPQAEVTVIGTSFTLACGDGRTQLNVDHGRVRMARLSDSAAIEVASGEFAVAAPGLDLTASRAPMPGTIFNVDFEDGTMPPDSIGTVVAGPERPGNRTCLLGVHSGEDQLIRARLVNEADGLFTYKVGADLTFDYWVDEKVESLSFYFWNRTQQASMGGFGLQGPSLVKGKWSRATVHLADLVEGSAHVRDGDLVSDFTIQTDSPAGPIYVDNVRVAVPR